jgi:hypothetical protein
MAAGYRWAPQKQRRYFAGVPVGGFRVFEMEEGFERDTEVGLLLSKPDGCPR